MKKQHLFKLAALLVLCCAILSCTKETPPTTIYGTVFNSITHEPVIGAEIEVGYHYSIDPVQTTVGLHGLSSAVSGNDGQYELSFGEINYDKQRSILFYVKVSASGYNTKKQDVAISIGNRSQVDVNLVPY